MNKSVPMYTGLALTVLAGVVPLLTPDTMQAHVQAAYPEWGPDLVAADANALLIYLLAIAGLGVICWAWSIWLITKEKRSARVITTIIFALATALALYNLTASAPHYDRLIPALYGGIGLLPSIAGAVTIILVWRRAPSSTAHIAPSSAPPAK